MVAAGEELRASVERILQSDTFRGAPGLRRLLKYLAERSASGDAELVKEYSIGIDVLGKSPDYDPRQDPTARIQVSRLRQKLADYYREEGINDPVVTLLPKGGFRLVCELRTGETHSPDLPPVLQTAPVAFAPPVQLLPQVQAPGRAFPWREVAIGCMVCLAVTLAWAFTLTRQSASRAAAAPNWSSELEQLWKPFIVGTRPTLLSIGNPLFVQMLGAGVYRDLSIDTWEQVLKSPRVDAVRKSVGDPPIQPLYYYAAIGEVRSAFQLGKFLAPWQPNVALVRSNQVTWQQLADNNFLLLGPPRFFREQLGNLPVSLELVHEKGGIRNLHPRPGEPVLMDDGDNKGFLSEEGEAYVLVTHMPGPLGTTVVRSFTSNKTQARAGAVQAFTDPATAQTLARKLSSPAGFPRYFQLVLHVIYKGGIPTQTEYVLHREIFPKTEDSKSK